MNIEEIKMDHFESFDELIKTCKMWIRDNDIDAYYRFFEFNCMKTLVTAYEKEKEKNKSIVYNYEMVVDKLENSTPKDKIKAKIEERQKRIEQLHPGSDCVIIDDLETEIAVLQSLLEKE